MTESRPVDRPLNLNAMEYYTKNVIKLASGKPAAEYITCITEEYINRDWNSEPSILRRHLTSIGENDSFFMGNAAQILGWWTSEEHFTIHFNQFAVPELNSELLTQKPGNLGQPAVLPNESIAGRKLWLIKAHISPLPLPLP